MRCRHVAALIAGAAGLLAAEAAHARVYSNTSAPLPGGLHLADVDGDGIADWVIADDKFLIVADTTFSPRGLAYGKMSAKPSKLFSGRFASPGYDTICGVHSLGVQCMQLIRDRLVTGTSQSSFIGAGQQVIVGDFDGDGVDDLLLHDRVRGVQLWASTGSGFVRRDSSRFATGDLAATGNKTVMAGNFADYSGEGTRTDLLVMDHATGTLTRYDSRKEGTRTTFRRRWTSAAGFINGKQIRLANVRGTGFEQIVARETSSGAVRFYDPTVVNGALASFSQAAGDLARPGNYLYFADLSQSTNSSEARRDDALIYDVTDQTFTAIGARTLPGGARGYVFGYQQKALILGADPDNDGITTRDELGGYDPDGNGISDADLPNYGATAFVKDVFVEIDYMVEPSQFQQVDQDDGVVDGSEVYDSDDLKLRKAPASPAPTSGRSLAPGIEAQNLAIREMAKKGINLHFVVDDVVPWDPYLGGGSFSWETHFDPIKDAYFTPGLWKFFHYAVFINRFTSSGHSGLSRGIPGSDLLVALGSWGSEGTSPEVVAGTLLHELGHNLGLHHGGLDDDNHKPNYLSVMNYAFQMVGYKKDGEAQFLYSELSCANINENRVDEKKGVQCTGHGTSKYETYIKSLGQWRPINRRLDCNGDGTYSSSGSYCNLNDDRNQYGNHVATTLIGGRDEYGRMTFNGGLIGGQLPLAVTATNGVGQRIEKRPSRLVRHIMRKNQVQLAELDLDTERKLRKRRPKLPPIDRTKLRTRIERLQLIAPDSVQIHNGKIRFDPSGLPPRQRKAAHRMLRPLVKAQKQQQKKRRRRK